MSVVPLPGDGIRIDRHQLLALDQRFKAHAKSRHLRIGHRPVKHEDCRARASRRWPRHAIGALEAADRELLDFGLLRAQASKRDARKSEDGQCADHYAVPDGILHLGAFKFHMIGRADAKQTPFQARPLIACRVGRNAAQMAVRRSEKLAEPAGASADQVRKMSERLKATIRVSGMANPSDIQARLSLIAPPGPLDCDSHHKLSLNRAGGQLLRWSIGMSGFSSAPEGESSWRKNPPGELSIDPVADSDGLKNYFLPQSRMNCTNTTAPHNKMPPIQLAHCAHGNQLGFQFLEGRNAIEEDHPADNDQDNSHYSPANVSDGSKAAVRPRGAEGPQQATQRQAYRRRTYRKRGSSDRR